ncbi:MAG: ISAs1 family transposase [Deltaproteobacteria bacterium]|nr:ISAs1 family transposase [Deltaproteobacteria bacterium]
MVRRQGTLFALKSTQPTLYNEAVRLLGALDVSHALACSQDHLGGERLVIRRLCLCSEMTGFHDWEHLRTVLRVRSQAFEHGALTQDENRYLLCSLSSDRLSAEQWLKLVRQYWMVENGPHWTLDVPLQEDAHPWIESEPQGALLLALLRRVAYNMLSLFRAVTLRAEDNRATPWKRLLERFKVTLYAALDSDLVELRVRIPGHAAAMASQSALG